MHPSLISYFFIKAHFHNSFHKTLQKNAKGLKKSIVDSSSVFSDQSKMRRISTEITNLLAEERGS